MSSERMSKEEFKARIKEAEKRRLEAIQNPPIIAHAKAVYESLLQHWEWELQDEDGKQIQAPASRILIDISTESSLTVTVFFVIQDTGDFDRMQKVRKFKLVAAGITEEIKDRCELYLERITPEDEEEYLKFGLKME